MSLGMSVYSTFCSFRLTKKFFLLAIGHLYHTQVCWHQHFFFLGVYLPEVSIVFHASLTQQYWCLYTQWLSALMLLILLQLFTSFEVINIVMQPLSTRAFALLPATRASTVSNVSRSLYLAEVVVTSTVSLATIANNVICFITGEFFVLHPLLSLIVQMNIWKYN